MGTYILRETAERLWPQKKEDRMDTVLNFLSGKKTYLVNAIGLLVLGLWIFQVIDTDVAMKALIALGLGGQISLRSAVAKSEAKAVETAQQVAALSGGRRNYIG